ncbi:MAG: SLC13 family permease [Bacillota bacterium]|nr:SLC13 family permease [Bacillota bacterium]
MRLVFRRKIPKAKLLLPIVISCLLGANITPIGASHNLVVNSMVEETLGYGFGFSEFMPTGVILLSAAVLYSMIFAWRLLPDEDPPEEISILDKPDLIETYGLADRLWEIWVPEESAAVEKSIREMGLGEQFGLVLVAVARAEEQMSAGPGELILEKDDVLLVLGREEKVRQLVEADCSCVLAFLLELVAGNEVGVSKNYLSRFAFRKYEGSRRSYSLLPGKWRKVLCF